MIDLKVFDKYDDVMNTTEVADVLGVHPATVTIIARDPNSGLKGFRATSKKKSHFRFPKPTVIAYVEAREFTPLAIKPK
jgi:hypothetical protein